MKPITILLIKYINNIISNPPCDGLEYDGNKWNRVYHIKCNNKLFVELFLQNGLKVVEGGMECLYMLGFIPHMQSQSNSEGMSMSTSGAESSMGMGIGSSMGGNSNISSNIVDGRSVVGYKDMCRLLHGGNIGDVMLTIYTPYTPYNSTTNTPNTTNAHSTVLDMMEYVMLRERIVILAEQCGVQPSDIPMYRNANVVNSSNSNVNSGNIGNGNSGSGVPMDVQSESMSMSGTGTGILGQKAVAFFNSNNSGNNPPPVPLPVPPTKPQATANVEFNPYQSYKINTAAIGSGSNNNNNSHSNSSNNSNNGSSNNNNSKKGGITPMTLITQLILTRRLMCTMLIPSLTNR